MLEGTIEYGREWNLIINRSINRMFVINVVMVIVMSIVMLRLMPLKPIEANLIISTGLLYCSDLNIKTLIQDQWLI